MDYNGNEETIKRVQEIDEKLSNENIGSELRTKLMFEQLLRGLYLNQV